LTIKENITHKHKVQNGPIKEGYKLSLFILNFGNLAAFGSNTKVGPIALRPILSNGLPFHLRIF